ncbi:MAG: histidine phosphatase family protein [Alphaproteobacteria bacterium]
MPRFYLVRHGQAESGWGQDHDPALSETGREQAEALARELDGRLSGVGVVTSPKRRARETAGPLARRWGVEAMINRGVSEVPAPTDDLEERGVWLRRVMRENWSVQDPRLQAWRANVVRTLTELPGDAVIFTHFIPINVAVGVATGDDRLVSFRPDYCSVTVLDMVVEELRLVERGREAETTVR